MSPPEVLLSSPPTAVMAQDVTVMVVAGTRPEVIKLAPVLQALRSRHRNVTCHLVLTGQHEMLADDMAQCFGLEIDTHLHEMCANDDLPHLMARLLTDLSAVIARIRPQIVLVHGDTATTLAGALAAFYRHIPIAHVEAGLRTHDLEHPFPEEANRCLVARLANINFAPTEAARDALIEEGIPSSSIVMTGNTIVDAVTMALRAIEAGAPVKLPELTRKHAILVTMHRRENWGEDLDHMCSALRRLIKNRNDIDIVLPVHPAPMVHDRIIAELSDYPHLHLLPPLDYFSMIALLRRVRVVLTDSGGLQEECLALHVPVLVMRTVTERREAVNAGGAALVGTATERILAATRALLDNDGIHLRMSDTQNPFGDGRAGERIAETVVNFLSRQATSRTGVSHHLVAG